MPEQYAAWAPLLPRQSAPRAVAIAHPPPAALPQMTHLPTWFKALVYSEVYLQLPFFFIASYAYLGAGLAAVRAPVALAFSCPRLAVGCC